MLVEPVSGPKPYPLAHRRRRHLGPRRRAGTGSVTNIGLLADLFHLANNGDDVAAAISAYADRVAHVQIADLPGRGEPGSGDLDLNGYLDQLEAAGYDGWVALEYNPTTSTTESLDWLPRDLRGAELNS